MNKTALALTAAVVAAISAPAAAENKLTVRGTPPVDDTFIRVAYGDLQLAQESGADALRTRVRSEGCP